MTLEHKYYSFEEMPEWREFIALGQIAKFRKVSGNLESWSTVYDEWTSLVCDQEYLSTQQFIPIPSEPKLYKKYLNGKRELAIKSLNGHNVLKVTFVQTAHGHKQTIRDAIPAINAFLEDLCGEGL